MAKVFESITPNLQRFIQDQQIFFVATAPLGSSGHVNLSPKGLDTFRVLSPNQVAYLDLTGSGNETSAHLLENGRITLMFCAFQASPMILRLYGTGRVILPSDPDWHDFAMHFELLPGTRQIITAHITRVQTSCGMAVPHYTYQEQRDELVQWAAAKDEVGLSTYQREKGSHSLDGLVTPIGQNCQT